MTSAPAPDERLHRTAVESLLAPKLGLDPITNADRVYDYGGVPGDQNNPDEAQRTATPPAIYVLLSIERRYVGPRRAGRAGRSGWRITVRYVGRTVDEARWALNQVTAAIDEVRLDIAGRRSTPVTHEDSRAIEVDDGRFSGITSWVYAV